MHIRIRRGWELPESAATPEALFRDRRRLVKTLAAGPIMLPAAAALLGGGAAFGAGAAEAATPAAKDPTADLYPAQRNMRYRLDRPITDEKLVVNYNNFYEYSPDKELADEAQQLKIRPWTVMFDGMVKKKKTVDIDTLIRAMKLEERLYRHRCVEAWSIAVPWTGFPMAELVKYAEPAGSPKYIEMQTFMDPSMAPGQKQFWYPWPYIEGLTMAEAMNELTLIGTGMYGKPMPKQDGAPLRLVVPWKYGFKSVKSIVRFTFTDKRPVNFWQTLQASEYGFWANVNPAVPHPRWSQATERVLGRDGRVPTLIYNGYGEYVADLYKDMKGEKLFM
jgi:sulfoxide reductase catalytic subunit YedY